MREVNYGTMSSESYNPKQFVLKALKKILRNNKNAEIFLQTNNIEEIRSRMINSIHLLEELDMMLNKETYNPAVERVTIHYQWMMNVFEEILEETYTREINPKRFEEIINQSNKDLQNLFEGFEGMKDDYGDLEIE